jgi:hypothetical protein
MVANCLVRRPHGEDGQTGSEMLPTPSHFHVLISQSGSFRANLLNAYTLAFGEILYSQVVTSLARVYHQDVQA